jgi:ABC-type transport system involved in Fe-S cluster assembly fused permease/ATPase subunit
VFLVLFLKVLVVYVAFWLCWRFVHVVFHLLWIALLITVAIYAWRTYGTRVTQALAGVAASRPPAVRTSPPLPLRSP